jgi:hypothetical protein
MEGKTMLANETTAAPLAKLAESLRAVFGDSVSADFESGELKLTIGPRTAWISEGGEVRGAANHSTVEEVIT